MSCLKLCDDSAFDNAKRGWRLHRSLLLACLFQWIVLVLANYNGYRNLSAGLGLNPSENRHEAGRAESRQITALYTHSGNYTISGLFIREFILDSNILCIGSHIGSIYMSCTHLDKMWSCIVACMTIIYIISTNDRNMRHNTSNMGMPYRWYLYAMWHI